MFCPNNKFLFIHIPKCGGSSVEVAMNCHPGFENIGSKPYLEYKDALPDKFEYLFGEGVQHCTIRDAKRLIPLQREDYTVFCVIRHPLDRYISHVIWRYWRFKAVEGSAKDIAKLVEKDFEDLWEVAANNKIFLNPREGIDLYVKENLAEKIRSKALKILPLPKLKNKKIKSHWLPQCTFVFDNYSLQANQLTTLENLTEYWNTKICNENEGFKLIENTRMASKSTFSYQEVKDILSIRLIEDHHYLYKADYELYNRISKSKSAVMAIERKG